MISGGAAGERLWFLGTLVRPLLDANEGSGRLAAMEILFPRGAAPPLHSHPQDESFYVLEGEVAVWIVDAARAADDGDPPAWAAEPTRRCGPGAFVHAPAGVPHSFRVESDTARMLVLSTPPGVEGYIRSLAEPAEWPWLPPPPAGPRASAERMAEAERATGMVRHGPPPPPA